ncbi:MAG: trypsin-like peptidase domain-containing protein [Dehalococcoidia bacterium]
MNIRNVAVIALASAVVGFAIAIGVVAAWPNDSSGKPASEATATAAATTDGASSSRPSGQVVTDSGCLSAADIYEQIRPSVVAIDIASDNSGPFAQQTRGEGTGIVLDTEGHILTNYHVAGNASALRVRFADGTSAPAHLVGSDPGSDLAVIQVNGANAAMTPATLADSSLVRVGDSVLAIGNPFHLEATLTAGIVSALGRTFDPGNGSRPIPNMIQTDAPVNPGNSGGPLLDCQGDVIGVVSSLENPTGQEVNVGVGFAIPSKAAQASLSNMLAGQTVSHPWLGIAGEDVTDELAKQLNLSVSSGLYLLVVTPGSPADQAGLHGAYASQSDANQSSTPATGGDVITKVDGQAVTSIQQVADHINTKNVGDTVELTVMRSGSTKTLQAKLAQWPDSQQ